MDRKKEVSPVESSSTTTPKSLEKQLHSRLKYIAVVAFVCAAVTLAWDFVFEEKDELEEIWIELEESPPPLNRLMVVLTFGSVGLFCTYVYWYKS